MTRWLLLLACALPTLAAAQQLAGQARSLPPPVDEEIIRDANGTVHVGVGFRLCVDATGRIACLEPLPDQNPALVNAMLRRIPSWRFSAATRDGAPASAESTLWVSIEGERGDAGEFEMRVVRSSIGPRIAKRILPRYPRHEIEAARGGGVLLSARVLPDGSLQQIEVIEEFSDKRFVAATLAAVEKWTFVPETIDGVPVGTMVRIPVVFQIHGKPAPRLRWLDQHADLGDEPLALDSPIRRLADTEG